MAITPTGSPAWVRAMSHEDYGGHTDKTNWQSQGVVNPRTDVGADAFSSLCSHLAACARTAPFCVISLTLNDTSPAAPTVNSVRMMTGVRSTSYAGGSAPTGFPTCTRVSDGVAYITFASSYDDPYGIAGAYTPAHAEATAQDSGDIVANTSITGQDVYVTLTNSGAAYQDGTVTVVVY